MWRRRSPLDLIPKMSYAFLINAFYQYIMVPMVRHGIVQSSTVPLLLGEVMGE